MRGGAFLDPVSQFRELYEQERASVYRAVRAIVLDAADAEDVTHDAFAKAYAARHRYRPSAPPGAWLHRIAVNTAISHLRRRRLTKLLPVRLYTGEAVGGYEAVEARSIVEQALARLSPRLRSVVALYALGYRREEMAEVLGVPSGTVASRLAKAMAQMRLALRDQSPASERWLDEGALP